MLTFHSVLGNIYVNDIVSESNIPIWRCRMPTFGEALGESFLEAVVMIEGASKLDEYFNIDSFRENGKTVTESKICGIGNLKIRKYYGDTIYEIGEEDIDIFENFGDALQIVELFDVSLIFYDSEGYVFFWLNKAETKTMSPFGVIKEDISDLSFITEALMAILNHLIAPIFLKLMLMNHDNDFIIKLHSKNYVHSKVIVDITKEYDELLIKYKEIKNF